MTQRKPGELPDEMPPWAGDGALVAVCAPVGHFDDDVTTACANCGATVVHRPHIPEQSTKLCLACANAALRRWPSNNRVAISRKTLDELVLFNSRTKGTH